MWINQPLGCFPMPFGNMFLLLVIPFDVRWYCRNITYISLSRFCYIYLLQNLPFCLTHLHTRSVSIIQSCCFILQLSQSRATSWKVCLRRVWESLYHNPYQRKDLWFRSLFWYARKYSGLSNCHHISVYILPLLYSCLPPCVNNQGGGGEAGLAWFS